MAAPKRYGYASILPRLSEVLGGPSDPVDFIDKQIAAPKSWEKFEDLCHALFRRVWANPLTHKHGRRGQPQHGVDIYGSIDPSGVVIHGVQCKGKDANYGAKATIAELNGELAKADKFSPPLRRWIFATTAPTDATIQEAARVLSEERVKRGRFGVDVLGWEDIQSLLASYPDVLEQFYPEYGADMATIVRVLKTATSNMSAVNDLLAIAANYTPASLPAQKTAPPVWLPVKITPIRDLKPALMGRPLGPADAVSCPRLFESRTLTDELGRGYFARLVGEAGAGKSICAYQTAYHFAMQGWRVLMLADPSVSQIDLDHYASSKRYISTLTLWPRGFSEGPRAKLTRRCFSSPPIIRSNNPRRGMAPSSWTLSAPYARLRPNCARHFRTPCAW